jgi:glycosyltransferase involved in cell wall biosynthesis
MQHSSYIVSNSNKSNLLLSIVIPAHNEEKNIIPLYEALCDVASLVEKSEIIFIDDGSTDQTYARMKECSGVRIIRFRKRFGQTAALIAGFQAIRGQYCVTLDADMQNDPTDILPMLSYLQEHQYDMVSGWRKDRFDSLSKRCISRLGNMIRYLFIHDGVRDSGCTLKVYRSECLHDLDLFGEMHRFIPALLIIRGYRVGEMAVLHHPRAFGKSKYTWTRVIKGCLDILSVWFWKKFNSRPLHLFGGIGILVCTLSICLGLYLIYQKLYLGYDLSNTALTYIALLGSILGVQFFIFGLISDILVRIYYRVTQNTYYDIKDTIDR